MNFERPTSNAERRTEDRAARSPAQTLDYARPRARGGNGGRLALVFGAAGIGLVACIVLTTAATTGTYSPWAGTVVGCAFIGVPLAASAALVSGVRGLMPQSRYRGRAMIGLALAAAAVFAAFVAIGWMAAGYR